MMELIRAGQLISARAQTYLKDVLPLLRDTLEATFTAALLFSRLTIVLLQPLLSVLLILYRALSPFILQLLTKLWGLFCLQPAHVLAAEAGFGIFVVILVMLERRFGLLGYLYLLTVGSWHAAKRRYKAFLKSVHSKSRLAAAALPHLLFIVGITLFHISIGKHIPQLTTGACVILFGCIRPVARTVLLLYSVEIDHHVSDCDIPDRRADLIMSAPPAPPPAPSDSEDRATMLRRRRRVEKSGDNLRSSLSNGATENENDQANANATPARKRQVRIHEDDFKTPEQRKRTSFTDEDESSLRELYEKKALRFWTVFGCTWALRSVAWYFCPAVFDRFVNALDCLLLYVLIWAQVSMTSGADVLYDVMKRIRGRGLKVERSTEQIGLVMRFAVATGLIKVQRASEVEGLVTESGFALLGVIFLITPRVATFIGTVLIGLVVPCYLTMGLGERGNRENWMAYWAMYAVVECWNTALGELVGWLPLWYHVKMVLVLWLQLPYYRGASTMLEWCMGHIGSALSSVKKQVVTPRKRKRA